MNAFIKHTLEDTVTVFGLWCLAISLTCFGLTMNTYNIDFDIFTGLFFLTYGLTILYYLVVTANNKSTYGRIFKYGNFTRNIILLELFNVSAYTLNRTIPVFHESVNWLVGFLMITHTALLLHAFLKNYKNTPLNHAIVGVSVLGFLFNFYQAIFVGMLYPITALSFWFFGISLHSFVPILYCIAFGIVLYRYIKASSAFKITAIISFLFAITFITDFSYRYYKVNETITNNFDHENQPFNDQHLPEWVGVSQQLPKNWIAERALKSGLVYTNMDNFFSDFSALGNRLNESIKHDPLVVISDVFVQNFDIPYDDKLKILRFMYDKRHQTERKLWSGDNLNTSDIVTNVQLFPEYRLAYTEKIFKIHNSQITRWGSTEEALYTFYLPEGSVVTSAALWVNDVERPAHLTTKSKANSAYTTIVGRERRDPLLLHWQEGNRVTVRVFPCTPSEDRQFKIGVTTPLKLKKNKLFYENIDFKGPYWKGAKETIHVVTAGKLENFSAPMSFKKDGTAYRYKGRYKSNWSLKFDALPLSKEIFSFNGRAFQLEKRSNKLVDFSPKEIYLDINRGWSKKELKKIWETYKDQADLFVYSNYRFEKLTEDNRKSLFKQLRKENFTLFPFYKINNPDEALVITQYNQLTPTLDDLKEETFTDELSDFFAKDAIPVRVYNLGDRISPYMRTLSEYRSIQLEMTSLGKIIENKNTFPYNPEASDDIKTNRYGNFNIKEIPYQEEQAAKAPDHLMRLFSYNNILKSIGQSKFNAERTLENNLIAEADEAYVVTPISSLIVLETQADYDRFDIKKNKNSLDNASISDSGSVPEPHEWLLIILVGILTLYFYLKK